MNSLAESQHSRHNSNASNHRDYGITSRFGRYKKRPGLSLFFQTPLCPTITRPPIIARHQQLPKMSVPSQPIMAQDSTAGTTAFSPKSAADRTTSYMWYVHVLVKVNTEERLRANIAPLLAHSTVCSTFASPARSGGLLSPEANLTSNAGSSGYAADDQQSRLHEMTDDLTDYLILWLFNHKILARLVESPPILEQAIGYTHSLSDVPEAYREEFCRRLYTLLFSKRVVEWPHGIDVPVPAVAAAQPVVIATGKTTAGVMELDGTRLEHSWPPTDVPSQDDNDNMIDNKNNNNNSDNRYPSIRAASRAAGSIWMRTPSPSTFGYDSEMERGGYFGTVDNPMPLNSLGNLGRSRNGYGPPPPVGTSDRQGESASRGQPMPPFPSPQQIGITPVVFQVSPL